MFRFLRLLPSTTTPLHNEQAATRVQQKQRHNKRVKNDAESRNEDEKTCSDA